MRRLLGKKPDPPQQPAPPPTVQRSAPPPPLFARFASSHSTGSSPSPPVISGPVPLAPRDSIHRQNGSHDGSPPKPSSTRVAAPPVQRNRLREKQLPVNGGKEDKPLPDPEQTLTRRNNPRAFPREPVQSLESRPPPMDTNDLPPSPQKSIPESRRRDDPPKNAEPAPVPLDVSPALPKPEDMTRKLTRTPVSGSPERKPPKRPAPESLSSGLLALQSPPDRPQARRKYSPLEAFGFVSGENSPAPSTTASSVNLPSQNTVSAPAKDPILPNSLVITLPHPELFDTELTNPYRQEPVAPSVSTTSSDSFPSLPGETKPTSPDLGVVSSPNERNPLAFTMSGRLPQRIMNLAMRVPCLERKVLTSPLRSNNTRHSNVLVLVTLNVDAPVSDVPTASDRGLVERISRSQDES